MKALLTRTRGQMVLQTLVLLVALAGMITVTTLGIVLEYNGQEARLDRISQIDVADQANGWVAAKVGPATLPLYGAWSQALEWNDSAGTCHYLYLDTANNTLYEQSATTGTACSGSPGALGAVGTGHVVATEITNTASQPLFTYYTNLSQISADKITLTGNPSNDAASALSFDTDLYVSDPNQKTTSLYYTYHDFLGGAVANSKIEDSQVNTAQVASSAVTDTKIASSAIAPSNFGDDSLNTITEFPISSGDTSNYAPPLSETSTWRTNADSSTTTVNGIAMSGGLAAEHTTSVDWSAYCVAGRELDARAVYTVYNPADGGGSISVSARMLEYAGPTVSSSPSQSAGNALFSAGPVTVTDGGYSELDSAWTEIDDGSCNAAGNYRLSAGSEPFSYLVQTDSTSTSPFALSNVAIEYRYAPEAAGNSSAPPNTPTLENPPDGSSVSTSTPTLTAQYTTTNAGRTGTLSFQICSDSGCSNVVASGSSSSGLQSGALGTWTTSTLPSGTYYWEARATDNASQSSSWSSSWKFTVTAVTSPPSNINSPAISGNPSDGQTLQASTGSWTNSPSYSYQWQYSTNGGSTWSNISGATGSTYDIPYGTYTTDDIRVKVTGTNAAGSASAYSALVGPVGAALPSNTSVPTISGSAIAGSTVTASHGSWNGTPTIFYSYQWQYSTDGLTWANVTSGTGATTSAYTIDTSYTNDYLRVQVTALNSAGSTTASSVSTSAVQAAPPVNTALPAISGAPAVGFTLTANNGSWSGAQPISYTYQWQYSTNDTTWSNISGSTSSSYQVARTYFSDYIRVQVTGTNVTSSSTANSTGVHITDRSIEVNGSYYDIDASGSVTVPYTGSDQTVIPQSSFSVTATLQGAGMGYSAFCSQVPGGETSGTLAFTGGTSYIAVVGQGSVFGGDPAYGGGGAGGDNATGYFGASGAGYTGIFTGTVTQGNALMIAGGAGGDNDDYSNNAYVCPGAGGGNTGSDGSGSGTYSGLGGSSTSGGNAGTSGTDHGGNGSALQGGAAYAGGYAGGGGGGYYGGGAGSGGEATDGSGGGGSGYCDQSAPVSGCTTTLAAGSLSAGTMVFSLTGTGQSPTNTGLPVISGTVEDGQTVTTDGGSWTGSPTITYSYQWNYSTNGTTWNAIPGATGSSYNIPYNTYTGDELEVVVLAQNSIGSNSATSLAQTIVGSTPVNTALPALSGNFYFDQTVNGSSGSWGSTGSLTYAYQWEYSADGTNWTPILAATSTSYLIPENTYTGDQLRLAVFASNSYGTTEADSLGSTVSAAPWNDTLPNVTGTAQYGQTLTTDNGSWSGATTISYSNRWQYSADGSTWWNIGATQVAEASYDGCAVTPDGSAYCWGTDSNDVLGNGSDVANGNSAANYKPLPVVGVSGTITQIATAADHTCALTSAGNVWCWGADTYGELGDNSSNTVSAAPLEVKGSGGSGTLANVTQIAVATSFSCALTSSNNVWCWGYGANGRLGVDSTTQYKYPVEVHGVGNSGTLSNIVDIAMAGSGSACAVTSSGGVDCWGYNTDGELGQNGTTQSLYPLAVKGVGGTGTLANVTQIFGGIGTFCAIANAADNIYCWGYNPAGNTGSGDYGSNHTTPVEVLGAGGSGNFSGATDIGENGETTCAVKSDGTVWCWGWGQQGQIGNNTTTGYNLDPLQVAGINDVGELTNATSVATSDWGNSILATLSDGSVVGWGYNSDGEIGDGTSGEHNYPVRTAEFPSATGSTLTLPETATGFYVRSAITATNSYGATTAYSAATTAIAQSPPINTASPTLSASFTVGNPASVTNGTWTNAEIWTYQWQKSANSGVTWTNTSDTTNSYTFVAGDKGYVFRVAVTGTGPGGSTTAYTNATYPIAAASASLVSGQVGTGSVNNTSSSLTIAPGSSKTVAVGDIAVVMWSGYSPTGQSMTPTGISDTNGDSCQILGNETDASGSGTPNNIGVATCDIGGTALTSSGSITITWSANVVATGSVMDVAGLVDGGSLVTAPTPGTGSGTASVSTTVSAPGLLGSCYPEFALNVVGINVTSLTTAYAYGTGWTGIVTAPAGVNGTIVGGEYKVNTASCYLTYTGNGTYKAASATYWVDGVFIIH